MKVNILLVFLLLGIFGFYSNAESSHLFGSKCTSDSLPNNILIINSFDAMSIQARKNKRELFAKLTNSLKNYLTKK